MARKASSSVPFQHVHPYRQEGLHGIAVPTHLLLFVHAFGDDLVDG
jgi:hypothetical protein